MRLRVTWPDQTYHGREWPPSPLRLYSALVAGVGRAAITDPALRAALEHLATLAPPVIYAPEAQQQADVAAAVPNNDGDRILNEHAAGRDAGARRKTAKLRAIRTRCPWHIDGEAAVCYQWRDTEATRGHLPALQRLAAGLSALGQGIDSAWARLDPGDNPTGARRWDPAASGGQLLRVPREGTLAVLEQRYQAQRRRVGNGIVHMVPEPEHAAQRYRSELEPARRAWQLLALRTLDDLPFSVAGTDAMAIAAMVRHAVHQAARQAGYDDATIAGLMGHGDNTLRISATPVPNVAHAYADGRIRRVLLSAPPTIEARHWTSLTTRLIGAELAPPGQPPEAMLATVAADDRLRHRFIGGAAMWTSATPVVLPGWDTRRGKPRPQRVIRRLLKHAGIDPAVMANAILEPAPRLKGSLRCSDARVPNHLADFPRAHITIRWRVPIQGPIMLGAGIGYGYGLFATA